MKKNRVPDWKHGKDGKIAVQEEVKEVWVRNQYVQIVIEEARGWADHKKFLLPAALIE